MFSHFATQYFKNCFPKINAQQLLQLVCFTSEAAGVMQSPFALYTERSNSQYGIVCVSSNSCWGFIAFLNLFWFPRTATLSSVGCPGHQIQVIWHSLLIICSHNLFVFSGSLFLQSATTSQDVIMYSSEIVLHGQRKYREYFMSQLCKMLLEVESAEMALTAVFSELVRGPEIKW